MGASVSVASGEMHKPIDASDIRATDSLLEARAEVVRLRALLGHLAKDVGFAEVVYDASDLVKGENEKEDFERCVAAVSHIRQCLHLHTQSSKRKERATRVGGDLAFASVFTKVELEADAYDDDSDSSDESSTRNSVEKAEAGDEAPHYDESPISGDS